MKYEIEIPDGVIPDGWEPVEYRKVLDGELFINPVGSRCEHRNMLTPFGPRLILRKKYAPEAWLKEAGFRFVVRDCDWFAMTEKPERTAIGWVNGPNGKSFCLKNLNFTPPDLGPDVADKDTLIEL